MSNRLQTNRRILESTKTMIREDMIAGRWYTTQQIVEKMNKRLVYARVDTYQIGQMLKQCDGVVKYRDHPKWQVPVATA